MKRRRVVALVAAISAIAALLVLRAAISPSALESLDEVGGEWSGTWHFPRGGPYMLGFHAPADAELSIDGATVARGRGEVLERWIYEAGDYAFSFRGPPGSRLLWHPPGRRGPPEEVPASSVSPLSPESASFGRWAGTRVVDGVVALAVLAILIALAAVLWMRERPRASKAARIAALAVFSLALVVRLVGAGDQGQTWDEDVNWSAGRGYVGSLLRLEVDGPVWEWNYEHPPVTKYVAGVGALLADGYGPSRALSALMMALACALLVPVGARLYSLRVGLLAGGIAALSPHLIAHGQIVGHESPTALAWALCLWASLRVHDAPASGAPPPPSRLWRRLALAGALVGLAISVRFINVLVAPVVWGTVIATAPPAVSRRKLALETALVVGAMALAVFYLLWPRLWPAPIEALQASWAKLRHPHGVEPYLGALTNRPPPSYFLVYSLATAPALVLLGALAGAGRALLWRERGSLIVALWFVAPFAVMASPVRQDGVRYIIPSLLALSVAAAAGIEMLAAPKREGAGRRTAALGIALVLYLIFICTRIAPYYLDYYGEHVGGPRAVAEHRRFEVGWWGEGLGAAVAYLNRHAATGAALHKECVAPSHLTWLRADLWAPLVRDPARADWILHYSPVSQPCPIPADAELVWEVSADGAPLARVYRRPPSSSGR